MARQLLAEDISVNFQGLRALDGVTITLGEGELLGLIGPNGAGKTTLLNVLSGFSKPNGGTVSLDGEDITRLSPPDRARLGVSRTFQSGHAFSNMTVLENLEVGGICAGLSRPVATKRSRNLLDLLNLQYRADDLAKHLPYGEGRKLALGRALSVEPSFVLLDEPATGLDEMETDEMVSLIASIRDQTGCAVLVVEHDMRLVMNLCERLHVIDFGRTVASGNPDAVVANQAVIDAYLGGEMLAHGAIRGNAHTS